MFYKNNTAAALAACERERTGNFGTIEYKSVLTDSPSSFLPDNFKLWKDTDIMTKTEFFKDPRLYEIKNCEILKDLTPNRILSEKIYLCKCTLCGKTFTRCRKTLIFGHSDCGCSKPAGYRTGMYIDRLILNMDELSKKVMYAKLKVLGNSNLCDTFNALYIEERPYSEYTALSLGMSMATLYRSRKKIHALWYNLKNEISEKNNL